MSLPIYLDYNATTPCSAEVVEAMIPYFSGMFGNAASKQYVQGLLAEEAVEIAREQVASLIEASPKEIFFTSGATEAINLVIKGYLENFDLKNSHLITVSTEHKAVLDTCAYLASKGLTVTHLTVDTEGQLDLSNLTNAIQRNTRLLVVMLANNETGVLHSLSDIYALAQSHGIALFSDATQAVGKIEMKAADTADFLCFSAHKMYGPKGAGALYINKKSNYTLFPQIHGGGHERSLRSGTLNVPAIVGFGKASLLATETLLSESIRLQKLRDTLETELTALTNVQINGQNALRLPHVSNITFPDLPNTDLLKLVSRHIAVSTGSACSSVINKPSHVLTAMGVSPLNALNSIRFSLGKYTTIEEIQLTIAEVKKALSRLSTI